MVIDLGLDLINSLAIQIPSSKFDKNFAERGRQLVTSVDERKVMQIIHIRVNFVVVSITYI